MDEWELKLIEVQQEINYSNSYPYYGKQYMYEEKKYWYHICKWLYEEENKVGSTLDIGCAYGTLSLFMKKKFICDTYCTDFIDVYLSKDIIKKYNFNFAINNIEIDDFPWDKKFDIILLTEVLEHFNFNPIPTLIKIRSLLNKNGYLYLSTPDINFSKETNKYSSLAQIPSPFKAENIFDGHVYVYNESELLGVIKKAGFKIERYERTPCNSNFNLMLKA